MMNTVKKFVRWNIITLLLVVVAVFCLYFFEDSHIKRALKESKKITENFMLFLKNKDFQKLYTLVENNGPVDMERFQNDINRFYNKYGVVKSFKYSGYNLSRTREEDDYSLLHVHYIIETYGEMYQCTFSIDLFRNTNFHDSLKIKDFTVRGREVSKEKFFYIKFS